MQQQKQKVDIDISKDILGICTPLVSYPNDLNVVRVYESKGEQYYKITANENDVGKLIGRQGLISNSIRTLVNVSLHNYKKRAVLKFEAKK